MAFWVGDGDHSQGPTGGRPYVHGGKRRVSHSDGGDGGDFVEFKRTRYGMNEFRPDGYEPTFGHGEYGSSTVNRFALQHNDLPGSYHAATDPGDSFNYPTDDDYYHHDHDYDRDIDATPPPQVPFLTREPIPVATKRPFYVIRERSPTPEFAPISPFGFGPGSAPGSIGPVLAPPGLGGPPPGSCAMERTASGISISSDTTQHSLSNLGPEDDEDASYLDDQEAARLVLDHVAGHTPRRRHPDSQHSRILKTLINPKQRSNTPDWPLDNDALRSIFSAANELFFDNRLAGRVAWDWSHPASSQYQAHIVGTTAVRRARPSGYETLIVLSSPILKDTKYNRRLLISTFLHEMIHSYLFVMCGLKAGHCGGHTDGFRQIAETIDAWVGRGYLRLGEMEADLEQFRERHDREHGNEREYRGVAAGSEWGMRGVSPWRRWVRRAERDGHDYYPTMEPRLPRPQQHQPPPLPQLQPLSHEDWQRHDRDGLHGRNKRGVGSPYV